MDNPQDALSALLSDPAALSSAMEMAKGLFAGMQQGNAAESENKSNAPQVKQSPPEENKTRLLLALKPYLSPKRSEKVGTVLALMKGLEVLGNTSLFEWGK